MNWWNVWKAKFTKKTKGGRKKLPKMYQSNNITISQQVLDIKSDGSINQRSHSKYSMKEAGLTHHRTQRNMWKGELDKFGNRDRCILLVSEKMIACQQNFVEQHTLLQHYLEQCLTVHQWPIAKLLGLSLTGDDKLCSLKFV